MPADTALAMHDRGCSLQGPPHGLSDPAMPASGAACPSRWQLATDARLAATNAATCGDDGLAGLLSLLLSQRLVRHEIRPIIPAWPVLILLENRAPMEHSAHLAPLSATNVQAAEAQIRAEMGFPAALAERDYHPGQSRGSRGFQWESFSELGECWCICTRCTQQPHDCGTPARDGRFRGTGLQPSLVLGAVLDLGLRI